MKIQEMKIRDENQSPRGPEPKVPDASSPYPKKNSSFFKLLSLLNLQGKSSSNWQKRKPIILRI